MTWREAWKLSREPYDELAFQTIYALRQGNLPSSVPAWDLVPRARRRVLQSKGLLVLLLGMIAFGTEALLSIGPTTALGQGIPPILFDAGLISGTLVLLMTFLWWTSLQLVPTLLSSTALQLLETLPVAPETLDRVATILLFRLVDSPVVAALVFFPLAVGAGLNSALGGLAVIPGVVAAIVVALAAALRTGRFFVQRVQGARGGGAAAVTRWAYLVLWTVPAFTMFALITFAFSFFRFLDQLIAVGQTGLLTVLASIFPFPLALLPPVVAGADHGVANLGLGFDPAIVGFTSAIYAVLLAYVGVWLVRAPRRLLRTVPESTPRPRAGDTRLRLRSTSFAILLKDIRIASRTPTFAFLVLLPLLNAVAVGLWTFLSNPPSANVFDLASATVASAALLATFFGPAFFAIEVMGYSYSRSLPISQRSLIFGKVALVLVLYLLASTIVLGLTLLRVFSPGVFALFILAELPAVVGAALLELGILFRIAKRRGLPIVNLYAGAWWATIVAIPGIAITSAPLLAFFVYGPGSPGLALPGMAGLSIAELTACAVFAVGLPGRGAL